MTTQLTKPQFVKVQDLENARSGYNVYVKVVSVEKSETQSNVPIVRAVVADETGCANAFFKGENAALIQEGKVLAIRNGTINLIKSHISLEVDIFGRITPETLDIQTVTTNNISEKEIQKRPRRNNREGEERRPRREGEERRPRREGEERRPRREGEEHKPRREGEDRPRREGEDRRPRREGEERRPRREGEEHKPRREGDFDRRPRREGEGEDRRPRREGDDRRPRREGDDTRPRRDENRGDRRPPVKFTKISAVEPGDEGLNFFGKVLKVEPVGRKARVVLGDETAVIRAFLFENEHVKVGETVVLFGAEARVVKEHIEVQVPREGRVDRARRSIEQVNEAVDISAKEWVEAN